MTEETTTKKKRPSKEPSSAEYAAMDKDIAEQLNAQPKQRIKLYQVPEDSSDKPWPDVTCAVNGYVYQLKRGEWVEVPQTVVEILEEAGHI